MAEALDSSRTANALERIKDRTLVTAEPPAPVEKPAPAKPSAVTSTPLRAGLESPTKGILYYTDNRLDGLISQGVWHHHLDLHLGQEAHVVLLAAVDRRVALLLAVPAHLAYGDRGAGANIGPNQALLFDLELVSLQKH